MMVIMQVCCTDKVNINGILMLSISVVVTD